MAAMTAVIAIAVVEAARVVSSIHLRIWGSASIVAVCIWILWLTLIAVMVRVRLLKPLLILIGIVIIDIVADIRRLCIGIQDRFFGCCG